MSEKKKKTIEVETKEPNAKKKKNIEVETKETNVKEKKKEVDMKVTKRKNTLASGSDSSATKRNEVKKTRVTPASGSSDSSGSSSDESYSYYSDSESGKSLASGSDDEPMPADKQAADKTAEQPAESDDIDWGGSDSESDSETSEEEADEPATGSIPVTGDSTGDATGDMPATGGPTGGIKLVRLTPATGGDDDFDEGYEKDAWTRQPWKKPKWDYYAGSWQKSSWQQKSSRQQKSSWTKWKRSYHYQPCYQLASGSSDCRSSLTWAGTSEVHSRCSDSESLLASGSMRCMRQQLADALSDWAAFPSSLLITKGGLEDFARRAAWEVKKLQDDPLKEFQEWALQTALPLEPKPASGGAGGGGYMSLKDVVTLHRGEVRQLGGVWAICDPNTEEFVAKHEQLKGLIVKPASGGPQVKVAKVFSLMDLFMAMGKTYSAKELYDAYLSCEIIARRRMRSKRQ